jgi:putative flippase GtrA
MNGVINELGRLKRFGIVGIIATLVHLGVAAVALAVFPALHELVANLMAFAVAFPVSLAGHARYTFGKRGHWQRFLVLALSGFTLNNGLLIGLMHLLDLKGMPAIALATLLVPAFVYIGSRLWVFRH